MKLKVCKDISDKFKNAKTISVSNKYVVVCTGKSAMIYDKNLNLLKNYNNSLSRCHVVSLTFFSIFAL